MPQSPFDDPFAELFGKLPDPRSRDLNASNDAVGDPAQAAPREQAAGAPAATADTGATAGAAGGAPMSRREAREAAARAAAAAAGPTSDSAAAPPSAPSGASRPTAPATTPASPSPVPAASARDESPASGPIGPVPAEAPATAAFTMRTPSRPTEVVEDESDPAEVWMLAGAARAGAARSTAERSGAAPAYARTGQVPVLTADPARRESDRGEDGVAGLDELFAQSRGTDLGTEPESGRRRRRRIGGWIALGVVLVILGGIAAGGWYIWSTYEEQIREVLGWQEPKDFEAGLANGEVMVTIESGDTGMPISETLYNSGVTKTPEAFYDYLIDTGQNPTFQPGVYALQYQMTSAAALETLLDPASRRDNTAQIPEGFTVDGTLERLAEGTGIALADFQAAVADPSVYGVTPDPAIVAAGGDPLEGWLFPATYTFDPGVTAQQVIQTLVDRTVQSLDAAGVAPERRQEILTIASIIQREARYEADMQKVSRVIQNRLDPDNQETFGLLQMDSTAQYGYGELHEGSASTSEEAQFDENLWNTYVHTGLPVGPISNPGDVAIDAALHPADGDWLYFVTVNLDTGETVFTSNVDDHNRAVEQWQAWCVDHPDSGC